MSNVPEYEINWIDRIIERDEHALSDLYVEFGAQVHGLSLYILKNDALAEEATQDTFLKIWDNAHQWDPNRSSQARGKQSTQYAPYSCFYTRTTGICSRRIAASSPRNR